MSLITGAVEVGEKIGEVFGDYSRGRAVRLGTYKGSENVKKLGHYNAKTGKRLGIYHY